MSKKEKWFVGKYFFLGGGGRGRKRGQAVLGIKPNLDSKHLESKNWSVNWRLCPKVNVLKIQMDQSPWFWKVYAPFYVSLFHMDEPSSFVTVLGEMLLGKFWHKMSTFSCNNNEKNKIKINMEKDLEGTLWGLSCLKEYSQKWSEKQSGRKNGFAQTCSL